jgi:hypothetical protein
METGRRAAERKLRMGPQGHACSLAKVSHGPELCLGSLCTTLLIGFDDITLAGEPLNETSHGP